MGEMSLAIEGWQRRQPSSCNMSFNMLRGRECELCNHRLDGKLVISMWDAKQITTKFHKESLYRPVKSVASDTAFYYAAMNRYNGSRLFVF